MTRPGRAQTWPGAATRSPREVRLHADLPHEHWQTTTLAAGLRLSGISAPKLLDGPMTAVASQAYADQVLVPTLNPGAVVVMDNLPAHGRAGIRETMKMPARHSLICRHVHRTSILSRRPSQSL